MTLALGARLGAFEVVTPLGAGGREGADPTVARFPFDDRTIRSSGNGQLVVEGAR